MGRVRSLAVAAACLALTGAVYEEPQHPPVNATSSPIVRTAKTISGQPLKLPQGAAEVAAAIVDIPVGGATAIHQHPWSRFVYVERGPVQIINHDTGETTELKSGQFFPEVISQWHEGRATGPEPARLLIVDLVPPGVNNMIMKGDMPM